jgi:pyridoxal phosphate enzyme (YggS family)
MSAIAENIKMVLAEIPANVKLVAISKTHEPEVIMEAYNAGHKIFGENKVQELVRKYELMPKDIEWHLVGHLQTNKVKYIAPIVQLIHSVDSLTLLKEINRQALKNNRTIQCLLQVYIATEETKFGLSEAELIQILDSPEYTELKNIEITGLMGMASFTDDIEKIKSEFRYLTNVYQKIKNDFFFNKRTFKELSMGMSSDYLLAIQQGSTMVRVGSKIFGERDYQTSI